MIYRKMCKLCGKEFETKSYQKSYCDDSHYTNCVICNKLFILPIHAYKKDIKNLTCSSYCAHVKSRKTSVLKYGKDFNNTTKAKQTRFKRYGSYESKESAEKRKLTCKTKFGRGTTFDIEKTKQTKLERYGNENYNNREKAKNTCIDKYDVDNVSKSDIVKNKIKESINEKYGSDYMFSSDYFKNKSKDTKLAKYGYENFTNSEKAKQTKLKKYGYSFCDPDRAKQTLLIKYGVPYYVMTENCRKLNHQTISKSNINLGEQLKQLGYNVEYEYHINRYSYDIRINDILIEIDPTYTHNSYKTPYNEGLGGKDKNYHLIKSETANNHGYRCIHVFDWDNKNILINLFCNKTIIFARKCKLKILNDEDLTDFLLAYHLQGTCLNQIVKLGLYYKDELVQVMTFGKPRYNKNYEWELLRLCTKFEYKVVGGSEKLFKYFIKNYNPKSIISYCDLAKFTGDVYIRLGFNHKNNTGPAKHWSYYNKHITDNLLRQRGYDQLFGANYGKGTSNEQLMLENGWLPVYDCGQSVYVWNKELNN